MRIQIIILVLSLFLIIPFSQAQENVESLTYPAVPAIDKPVIWIITTPPLVEPARVNWQTLGVTGAGDFNKISDSKWYCFFSNDNTSNCGPSPFTGTGGTTRRYQITVKSAQLNKVYPESTIPISSLNVQPVTYRHDVNSAYMLGGGVFDENTAKVEYKILSAGNLTELRKGDAAYTFSNGFVANFTDNPLLQGKYFVVFELTQKSDGKKGGSVTYFEIAGSGIKPSPSTTTDAEGGLDIEPAIITNKLVNQSDTIEFSFKIKNPTNTSVSNLTASLPSGIGSLIDILVPNGTIEAKGSENYKVIIPDIQSGLRIDKTFNITGLVEGNLTTVSVPLKIEIDVIIPQRVTVEPERPLIDVSPSFFSQKVIIGTGFSDRIFIKNVGKGKLTDFGYELRGISQDVVKVTLPQDDIAAGGQSSIAIEVNPAAEQKYSGTLLIMSNGGEREVGLDIDSFEDISEELRLFESQVNDRILNLTKNGYTEKDAKALFAGVLVDIESAKNDWDFGKYTESKTSYKLAQGKLDGIESLISTGKKDSGGGLLIPVIIIVIVGVLAFFLIQKLKKRGTGDDYGIDEGEEGEETEYPPEEGGEEQPEEDQGA
ncbi:MAG TPA: hypothetical protein VJB06_01760 [archaeon]|nr:hypothetical protein [archaeon]